RAGVRRTLAGRSAVAPRRPRVRQHFRRGRRAHQGAGVTSDRRSPGTRRAGPRLPRNLLPSSLMGWGSAPPSGVLPGRRRTGGPAPVRVSTPGRSFLHYHPADSTSRLTPSIRTWLDGRGATLPEYHCNRRGEQVYVGGFERAGRLDLVLAATWQGGGGVFWFP